MPRQESSGLASSTRMISKSGVIDAAAFYRDLFADTTRSATTPINTFLPSGNQGSVALHFRYRWTLKSGKLVEFECVDVFELSADRQQFTKLTIIYDTAPIRDDFAASRRGQA